MFKKHYKTEQYAKWFSDERQTWIILGYELKVPGRNTTCKRLGPIVGSSKTGRKRTRMFVTAETTAARSTRRNTEGHIRTLGYRGRQRNST
eukprot:3437727-Heterocapsa_arctica.AAC.1